MKCIILAARFLVKVCRGLASLVPQSKNCLEESLSLPSQSLVPQSVRLLQMWSSTTAKAQKPVEFKILKCTSSKLDTHLSLRCTHRKSWATKSRCSSTT